MTRPTFKKDWGWCRSTCNQKPSMAKNLQETKLNLLSREQCSDFAESLLFNHTYEFCAGKKNYFPKIWKFKRIKKNGEKSHHFKLVGQSTNYLGFKKTKYNFYLGGTDSCQGNDTFTTF